MHGGGTVSGLHDVAAMASKVCCAFTVDGQRHHHEIHHQSQLSPRMSENGSGLGSGITGKGGSGSGRSGSGVNTRTSMISYASSSTTITGRSEEHTSELQSLRQL